ncbi:MAG: ABC transporter permease subunit [Phycisphaerales bacterium]|nr:ABC transporter permease subunit [Phycisphaerales bacterium]
MRRYRRVWTVYRKELIESLRDRRTLMAMVLVPLVLYPVLMLVLVQALRSETGRQERQNYTIVVPNEAHRRWLESVWAREEEEREARKAEVEQLAKASDREVEDAMAALRTEIGAKQITIEVAEPGLSLWDLVSEQRYDVAVLAEPVPDHENFADHENLIVQILYSDTDPLSEVLFRQLNYILDHESLRIAKAKVTALSGNDNILSPLRVNNLSTTSPDRQLAKALALVVPFLLVTMTITGAIYPAIDLTAGERERGTLETLAVSPVPSGQIVAGKFGVIVTIAMVTTMLNLASMTAVLHFGGLGKLFAGRQPTAKSEALAVEAMISNQDSASSAVLQRQALLDNLNRRRGLEGEAEQRVGFVTTAAPIVLLAMVPFAVLFGGIMLAVCSFARTFKEAQNYMVPVMMSAIVPGLIVSYMPTIRLEGPMLVMPVANIVVLMRELFLGNFDLAAMSICLLSTCFYAAVAVIVAVRVYGNEAVLFSDVGNYKTLVLRKFIRPQAYPPAAFALLTVAVLFPLNFYAQSSLIKADAGPTQNLSVIAGTQLFLFAMPVIFLAWYMKLDFRRTFSLHVPGPFPIVGTLLVAASVAPVSNLLQRIQFHFFPLSDGALKLMEQQQEMLFGDPSLWLSLVVLALLPGICEEVLFRGFLLGGVRQRSSTFQAVLVVGLIFGLYHVDAAKVPVVSLMGMLLTFVCLRTGSIYPAVLIHIVNNGLGIASTKFPDLKSFFGLSEELVVQSRTIVFIMLFVIGLLFLMKRRGSSAP